ncbi:MAG TPA: response regulator [Bacteroidales bacterium]|nr:response regulator [Bacteroidales bacterium]
MLRKIRIGRRLVAGYAIILAFSMVTSLIAIIEINNIWSNTKGLYERPYAASNLIKDIKINALNMRRYMLDMSALSDTSEFDELVKLIDAEEARAKISFGRLEKMYGTSDIGIEESFEFFRDWKPLRDDVIAHIRNNDVRQSSDLLVTRNRVYVAKLFDSMQVAIDEISKMADDFYANAYRTKEKIVVTLIIILAVALAISLMFAYLITKSISGPLESIVGSIREIARGNLSNPQLRKEADEIGELAGSFNQMQDDLKQKALVAQRISKGDFSVRLKPSGENDIVAESINMIADNFDQVVKQAEKVADGDFRSEISRIAPENSLTIVIARMLDSLREVVGKARKIAQGDFSGEIIPKSESDELAVALNRMTAALRTATEQNARQSRLKTGQNELNEQMRGDLDIDKLSRNIIRYVSKFTGTQIGALYLYDEENKVYRLTGSYAYTHRKGFNPSFRDGEGLVGQAAHEQEVISFSELPDDYVRITSGIGNTVPRCVLMAPFVHEGKTLGVIELGSVSEFSDESSEFIKLVLENIAVSVASSNSRTQMARLLEVTRAQSEELQVQQEELRQSNEELEAQTTALKKSEESLQSQQEELRVTNEELEDKTKKLEEHRDWMEKRNRELEKARLEVEKKAKELEITNRYKSEFLANMSHELRTPLNSLLLLSQSLMENKAGNLTAQQIQSASIIYNSGNDLLKLINDILDLSRIESGKMSLAISEVSPGTFETSIKDYFAHMVEDKGLEFKVVSEPGLPEKIVTDEQRLNQILRNLMSNAIKFTEKGGIYVTVRRPAVEELHDRNPVKHVAFSIRDTGIGIPEDKQQIIFEAFQQVDGSLARKYSGSGLGLSITRELCRLIGGEIRLISEPGKGSEFTIIIPEEIKEPGETPAEQPSFPRAPEMIPPEKIKKHSDATQTVSSIEDDRKVIGNDSASILIIEDDTQFAALLSGICRDKGFRVLAAATGEEGTKLAEAYKPRGIILDINLPGISGWDVLETLKNSPETRHIPVHIISGYDETIEAYNKGAIGYLTKPVTRETIESAIGQMQSYMSGKIRNLLIIEDDKNLLTAVRMLLEAKDINITESTSGRDAIKLIGENHYDCIVLDLGLPDMSGFEMLKSLTEKNIRVPPVVVYTGKELTREENEELQKYTSSIIIKGVKSQERLLDETALFLHRMVKDMPEKQKKMLVNLYDKEEMFRGKNIMIVDDDMRNVFAITSVLESGHMNVVSATDGNRALELLEKNPKVDLILMDIMMPGMDGYETVKKIRKNKKFRSLPVIMLTAKAMKEDREKSIAAGANDYLSKPVDIGKLLNLMRIWLYQ